MAYGGGKPKSVIASAATNFITALRQAQGRHSGRLLRNRMNQGIGVISPKLQCFIKFQTAMA
ncbi:MAG TPA: hypothetical protein DCZ94_06475 [Lentisphaeria bacterium]|nr:MAG: hypothetical protein A2X48_10905 [Lentisphaerae bacterium GWF2_49_21]HBC86581.1 hypothetical protein [Lentisphaeria bacterium]